MHVSDLFRYPVKSLGGGAIDAVALEHCGLAGDRRWMVVDARGRFVTRREVPAMALVGAEVTATGLRLTHPTLGGCAVPRPGDDAPAIQATIWRDTVALRSGSEDAGTFLSKALGRSVRLAYQADPLARPVHSAHAREGDHVSLADGFPLLVTTEASLAALNARLAAPVGMAHFRPNLVIAGAEPWSEDGWRLIRVGGTVLRLAKPCSRCVIVTQEPETGERRHGDEPLATLRAMGRMTRHGIMFGENAVPERLGTLRIGDPVEVLEEGERRV